MVHSLLDPGRGAVATATTIAALSWFTTSVDGLDRAVTTLLAFLAAFLAFNAASIYLDG